MFITGAQFDLIIALYILILVAFAVYILRDNSLRNINKVILMALLVFAPFLGILINLVYLTIHKLDKKKIENNPI